MTNTQTPRRYIVACIGPACDAVWTCTFDLTDPEDARRQYALINNVQLSSVYFSEADAA